MEKVDAIYERGVFRPVRKLDLHEGERVKITVEVVVGNEKDSAEDFSDIAVETGITDFAENIDYYLYGLPKQKNCKLMLQKISFFKFLSIAVCFSGRNS